MKRIQEDIKTGNFRPVYLLYGEEEYLKRLYRNRLIKAVVDPQDTINLNRYEGRNVSVQEVISQAQTLPFFADHRLLVLEDTGFFKGACQELADALDTFPEETVLLFSETEVDKRGKLYKNVKARGCIVEMTHQNESALMSWMVRWLQQNGKKITRSGMELLLQRAGDDMENISHEMEKLVAYTYDREGITAEDVMAICSERIENKIFEMMSAMAEKKQRRTLELYYDLLALKEAPMKILVLIARQFQQIYQVKDLREQGFDQGTIASRTGMQGFVVRNCLRQAEHFSMEMLRQALTDCVVMEEAVKTGKIEDRLAVEILLIRYSEDHTA